MLLGGVIGMVATVSIALLWKSIRTYRAPLV